MSRMIQVKAAPSLGNRVALSERHESHPAGEVFIAGQDSPPVEVAADTPGVTAALNDKMIVVLDGAALAQAQAVAKAADEKRHAARASALAAANPNPSEADAGKVRQLEERVAKAEAALEKATEKLDATIAKQQADDEQKAEAVAAGQKPAR